MPTIKVNARLDVDVSIDDFSKSEKKELLSEFSDEELIAEMKRRLLTVRPLNVNQFTLQSNHIKRKHLIDLLDLPSFSNDDTIIKAVKENI